MGSQTETDVPIMLRPRIEDEYYLVAGSVVGSIRPPVEMFVPDPGWDSHLLRRCFHAGESAVAAALSVAIPSVRRR